MLRDLGCEMIVAVIRNPIKGPTPLAKVETFASIWFINSVGFVRRRSVDLRERRQTPETLFRLLVHAGSRTEEDTRRRAHLNTLDATSQQLARKLADERLLVTAGTIKHYGSTAPPNGRRCRQFGGRTCHGRP